MSSLIAFGTLGVHEWSLDCVRELKELALTYVDLQSWNEAESVYERTLPWFDWAYPRHHPLIGLQYYTHGRLAWLNKNTRVALASFEKAKQSLPVSHGPRHPLVLQLEAAWSEARAEADYNR